MSAIVARDKKSGGGRGKRPRRRRLQLLRPGEIGDTQRRETVLAALQLSAQKWEIFTVHRDDRFQRLCVELALEHGFKIANPELQHMIARDGGRLRVEYEPQLIRKAGAISVT